MSWGIFLGIPSILVDFDDLFSWILQKSQEFVGNLWILEKIPGKLEDFDAILLYFLRNS